MERTAGILHVIVLAALSAVAAAQERVTFGSLVREARDLQRLARLPAPDYEVVQWSSYDRRSTGPESAAWYSNGDGFGGEPIPNVAAVLEAPGQDGVGRYLLGEARGPGALVRTWSAGMNGTIRAFVDGQLVWDGPAVDFLVTRADGLGLAEDHPARAFEHEDADHLPVPFADSLRVEWTGAVRGLHFYQIQVRRYASGTAVRPFARDDPERFRGELEATARAFASPATEVERAKSQRDEVVVAPGGEVAIGRDVERDAPGEVLTRLRLKVDAEELDAALRGVVMRIAFDGSQRPQVEAPVGDFFGSGPGINPYQSLPMSVGADGWFECRFPMPYARSCRIAFRNLGPVPARITCEREIEPFTFDDDALHFRARWRIDHDLLAEGGAAPFDLPFIVLRGAGRFVGCAVQIVNPSGIPTPGGNWWGEGDEKVFVDDDVVPSTFGTGSEDYFDYSWSRPSLFAHPYCGQPLCSGPGTSGFVSNHRFQILDDLPFDRFLAFLMELWTHRPLPGVDYARIAYLYARPGALDDHLRIQARDVVLPELPVRAPVADGGARGATIHDAWDLRPRVGGEQVEVAAEPLATRHRVVAWHAKAGEVLELDVPCSEPGVFALHLVAVHAPEGAQVRARIGASDASDVIDLKTAHARRVLSVDLAPRQLDAGEHTLRLTCLRDGFVGLDYLWTRLEHVVLPGCIEGEAMTVVAKSDGVEHEVQGLGGGRYSGGRQLWIRAREVGDFVELEGRGVEPGRYRAVLRPTESYDYAVLAIDVAGERRVGRVDCYARQTRPGLPVDLGTVSIGDDGTLDLRITVIGANPAAAAPRTYFGVDGVVLERID